MSKVWCLIPPSVYYDEDISDSAKTLYGRLLGLVNETGYCWAGNEFLAKDRGVDERTIQRHLNELKKAGYVEVEQDQKRRFLRLKLNKGDKTVVHGVTELSPKVLHKDSSVTKEGSVSKTPLESRNLERDLAIREVFNFWVEARQRVLVARGQLQEGRKQPTMKLTTGLKGRKSAINARLNEGYSVEAIKRGVLGCLGNDYNVEGGYIDITLVCRSSAKLEQYIAWFNKRKKDIKKEPEEWDG